MKITNPGHDVVLKAANGDLAAIDAVLLSIQPGVYNLAVRMLGNRDDAADAAQEILMKVVTHLGSFRGDAAFTTWVFQIARNHLLTASTRSRESPEVSLDAIAERLQTGLDFAAWHGSGHADAERALTPEDKLAARQTALGCTQSFLMALDREQRLVTLLDSVFNLSSQEAADVLDISAAAYRQRLARTRAVLDPFVKRTCGLANSEAACRCERQLPAIKHLRAQEPAGTKPATVIAIHRAELAEAERQFDQLLHLSAAAALLRAHPEYRAPESMIGAIRAVLRSAGYWDGEGGRALQ